MTNFEEGNLFVQNVLCQRCVSSEFNGDFSEMIMFVKIYIYIYYITIQKLLCPSKWKKKQ